jgi:hypothetical protein
LKLKDIAQQEIDWRLLVTVLLENAGGTIYIPKDKIVDLLSDTIQIAEEATFIKVSLVKERDR